MTEAQWLGCDNQFALLDCWNDNTFPVWGSLLKVSERRLRLFGAACVRLIWNSMWEGCRPGVEAAERYAEGLAGAEALGTAELACLGDADARSAARYAIDWVLGGDSGPVDLTDPYQQALAVESCRLLREVVGNPFCPVAFDPAWRTDTAVILARQMYYSRDFGAMPILADALQDAGCDSEQVLNHCRDTTAIHVRGCWVCDAVLGTA